MSCENFLRKASHLEKERETNEKASASLPEKIDEKRSLMAYHRPKNMFG